MDNFLCFGLSNAPAFFNRISSAIARKVHLHGFTIVIESAKNLRRQCNVPWATKNCQRDQFKLFCRIYNLCSLPATVKTVALLVAYLSKSLQYTTVTNYVASTVLYHHHHNIEALNIEHFPIKQAITSLHRLEKPFT